MIHSWIANQMATREQWRPHCLSIVNFILDTCTWVTPTSFHSHGQLGNPNCCHSLNLGSADLGQSDRWHLILIREGVNRPRILEGPVGDSMALERHTPLMLTFS